MQSNKRISKNDDKHSCSVAKTKVSLVCLWKSAVLRYQSRGESKNHNRIWVRVTERDLSVCVFMWDVSKMEGISIEKTKNLILILDIFQILKQTYMNACIFLSLCTVCTCYQASGTTNCISNISLFCPSLSPSRSMSDLHLAPAY